MKLTTRIKKGLEYRINNSLYNWDNIDASFVTSTGRTGTMFFSHFFSENFENTKAVHEPWPDLHDVGYNKHHSNYSDSRAIDIIKRERSTICKELNKENIKYYLESNYNLSYILPYLEPVFGKFKLVHLIREPKSQLQSIFSVKEAKRHIYADFDNRPRIGAEDFPDDPFRAQWKNWNRFEKLCWHYYKVNTLIGSYVDQNPDSAITVTFDEIFNKDNDYAGLFKIAEFIGTPMKGGVTKESLIKSLDNKANKTKKKGIEGYDHWSPKQQEVFHLLTDPIAKKYGFL